MKISFLTLGCRVNQAETEELKRKFRQKGFKIVGFKEKADIYFINACSVTNKAEKESRQAIHQARRQNEKGLIIVAGCFLEKKLKEIDLYISNQEKNNSLEKIISLLKKKNITFKEERKKNGLEIEKIRALIKIEEGCDEFCSFCIVPFLRGKPISFSPQKIIQEIKEREKEGYKEIVLVGTNLSKYNWRGKNLVWLIEKILKETEIPRLRLSSLWPGLLTEKMIRLLENKRFCPHFHLSLQSGSERILSLMGRNYKIKKIEKTIKEIRERFPEVIFTGDIIVGFPGEKEKDFQQTLDFVKKMKFYKLHLFRYSPRPGTKAAVLKGQLPEEVKKERLARLKKIIFKINQEERKKLLGQKFFVLFEGKKEKFWFGFTENYLKVYCPVNKNLKNKIKRVKLEKIFKDGFQVNLTY